METYEHDITSPNRHKRKARTKTRNIKTARRTARKKRTEGEDKKE